MSGYDDGRPAFPATEAHGLNSGDSGLSRREYFAAHAPAVPDWFKYQSADPMPVALMMPDPEKELTPRQREEVQRWKDGAFFSFNNVSAPVRDFLLRYQKADESNEAFDAWRLKSRQEKFFAWRWYYADMMIKQGSTN